MPNVGFALLVEELTVVELLAGLAEAVAEEEPNVGVEEVVPPNEPNIFVVEAGVVLEFVEAVVVVADDVDVTAPNVLPAVAVAVEGELLPKPNPPNPVADVAAVL